MGTTNEVKITNRKFLGEDGLSSVGWTIDLVDWDEKAWIDADLKISDGVNGIYVSTYRDCKDAEQLRDALNEYLDAYERVKEICDERNKATQPESV